MGVPCVERHAGGGAHDGDGGGANGGDGLHALVPAAPLPPANPTVIDRNLPRVDVAQLTQIFGRVFNGLLAAGHVHKRRALPLLYVNLDGWDW